MNNVGSAGTGSSKGWHNLVAVLVLAGELFTVIRVARIHAWFANNVPSNALRITLYAALFLALSLMGQAVWPRIRGTIAWVIWSVGFGAIGAFFSYLSSARNFGRGFSVIYGPVFLAQAMIGVAGLARLMLLWWASDDK